MRPSWLCKWRSKVKSPLFCISGTIGPIELKFCMHMECDQASILHKNVKLIWGHLGYANEGQRSNLIFFCISEATGRIEPKFCMHMLCDQPIILHNNTKLTWGHLGYANEGQRSNPSLYCISATTGPIEPKFCMHMQCDQPIILYNNNKLTWGHLGYANEGQRSNLMNFVFKISQKQNEQSSSNFHSIFALMKNGYNNLFSLITQPWRHLGAILWFHFIIHIFITVHHKLIKFSTHKLQAIV